MAVAQIPVSDFQASEVPPVCVFTGVPAENVFRFKFSGVTGGLPVNGDAVAALAKLRRVILVMAGLSVAGFLFSMATGSVVASIIAVGLMIIALVMTAVARKRLVRGRIVGDKLMLTNVHFAFADAIDCPPGVCQECPSLAECKNQSQHA